MNENKEYKELKSSSEHLEYSEFRKDPEYFTSSENSAVKELNKSKTKSKNSKNFSMNPMIASFIAISVAAVTLVAAMIRPTIKMSLNNFSYTEKSFSYEISLEAKEELEVFAIVKTDKTSVKEIIEIKKDMKTFKGTFQDLMQNTSYIFEVYQDNGLNTSTFITQKFTTKEIKLEESYLSNFTYRVDHNQKSILWNIEISDKNHYFSQYRAKIYDSNYQFIKEIELINQLIGEQIIDISSLTNGLYYLSIEADTTYPPDLDLGISHKVVKEKLAIYI